MSDDVSDDVTGRWDHGTLPPNVSIGANCFIERRDSFARFRSTQPDGLTIGDECRIYAWTTFNVEPEGRLAIGNRCVLVGPVFMCAERITIGDDVVVSYGVTIADSDFHPRDPELRRTDAIANAPGGDKTQRPPIESRPVTIGDGVWIGIGAIVLKGVTIGAGAKVAAGAVVSRDVPDGGYAAGNPASVTAMP